MTCMVWFIHFWALRVCWYLLCSDPRIMRRSCSTVLWMTLPAANKRINAMNYRLATGSQPQLVSTGIVMILSYQHCQDHTVSHVHHNINGKNILDVFHVIRKQARTKLYLTKILLGLFETLTVKGSYLVLLIVEKTKFSYHKSWMIWLDSEILSTFLGKLGDIHDNIGWSTRLFR